MFFLPAEEDKECLRKKIREQATELETKEESNHQKDMEHHAEIMRVRFEVRSKIDDLCFLEYLNIH